MAATGGSIETVNINNRLFPVDADADAERDLGGFTKTKMPNGDGSARSNKKRKVWSISGLTLACDDERQDQEFLQNVADSEADVPMGVTLVTGITYGGQGTVVEDIKFSTDGASVEVTLSGPFKLEQQ